MDGHDTNAKGNAMTTTGELRVGDNVNSPKCRKMFRGDLLTGDYCDLFVAQPTAKYTEHSVFSMGNGMIQLAIVQPYSGKLVDVSAPMPAACITRAGRSEVMGGYMHYWKPRN
jgi:hypothetical protein